MIERIAMRETLAHAFVLAARGTSDRPEVRAARADLGNWLNLLAQQTRAGSVEVGGFRRFVVCDPKRRVIHAVSFRQRVLHQSIMRVCEPVFERVAVFDSYACRTGKGVHAARARAHQQLRRWSHVLHLDIRRYFDSKWVHA